MEYSLYPGQLAHQTSHQSSTRGISSVDAFKKPTTYLLHLSTFCGYDSSSSGISYISGKLMSFTTQCHSVLLPVRQQVAATHDFDISSHRNVFVSPYLLYIFTFFQWCNFLSLSQNIRPMIIIRLGNSGHLRLT